VSELKPGRAAGQAEETTLWSASPNVTTSYEAIRAGPVGSAVREVADEGAARARQAGLNAEAVVARGASAEDIAKTLCDLAETRDATLVVVGRRGMSRLKELVLGSVSNAAIHDGRRAVLVVPDGEL
jgi:nucleotide-binding universal stress UspA family protein